MSGLTACFERPDTIAEFKEEAAAAPGDVEPFPAREALIAAEDAIEVSSRSGFIVEMERFNEALGAQLERLEARPAPEATPAPETPVSAAPALNERHAVMQARVQALWERDEGWEDDARALLSDGHALSDDVLAAALG